MLQLQQRAAPYVLIAALLTALALLVGVVDRHAPLLLDESIRAAGQRKELPPEEIAYWRRHERNQALCRGQTYIAQCCDHSFDSASPTCLNAKEIR